MSPQTLKPWRHTHTHTHSPDDVAQDDVIMVQDPLVLTDENKMSRSALASWFSRTAAGGTFRTGLFRTTSDLFVMFCCDVW